ncbi:MAG: hypothetical protein P8Y79_13870 [Ignavibacteriaceae bacterium]
MSFYPQPNKYQCGPFALKYALVMLGKFESERSIAKKAGSNWWNGTDEIGLAKAAKYFNCKMKYFRRETGADAIKSLTLHLRKGYPCIISVDNWEHWISVVNWQQGKFPDNSFRSYDGYALVPQFKIVTKAKFTLAKAKYVMNTRNQELARNWDTYFNDLTAICRPVTSLSYYIISFNEFLRRHEKMIVEHVAYWHGSPSYSELRKILTNLSFVAEVYNLVIYEEDRKQALIDLTSLLMMYACGKYGMHKIYSS